MTPVASSASATANVAAMFRKLIIKILASLVVLLYSSLALGQSVMIGSGEDEIFVLPDAQYYEDNSGSLTISDVSSPAFTNNFIDSERQILHFGLTSAAYWIRFDLDWAGVEPGQSRILEIGPPKHVPGNIRGGVDVYLRDTSGNFRSYRMGSMDAEREIATLGTGYALQIDSDVARQVYLRVTSARSLILPISLWETNAFMRHETLTVIGLGLQYGILFAMLLYNLFLFASIRETSFLYYVSAIAVLVAFVALDSKHLRFMFVTLGQDNWFIDMAERIVYPMIALTSLLFQRSLLRVWEHNTLLDRWLLATLAGYVGIALIAFLPNEKPYQYLFLGSLLWLGPITIYTNIDAIRRGKFTGLVHMSATTLFLFGAVNLALLTIWPQFPVNVVTSNAFNAGLLSQVLLLSFGLAFRYNEIKEERESAQQQAILNLVRSEQVKDDLLANVSHELRTPLHGINGLAEAALGEHRRGNKNNDLLIRNLELIQASGDRLTRLVDDLLDFSSAREGRTSIKMRPVNLVKVVELVIATCHPLIGKKNLDLRCEMDNDLPWVDADENRLQQILLNLTSNAIKFTHSGEVVISAGLEADNSVLLSVRDTGIGIHHTDHETIFKSFERLPSYSINSGGMGLGLPLAKRMVELHGGVLTVESELDSGSTFSFRLRASTDQAHDTGLPNLNKHMLRRSDYIGGSQADSRPKLRTEQEVTILVVDDDAVNRELMIQQLDEYHVIDCADGAEALTQVEREKPDLVLLDLMMPGLSGYDVCHRLRLSYSQIELPIILVTAKNHLEDLTLGFDTGANDYLPKPYHQEELLSRVENQLRLSELHRINEDNIYLRAQIEKYVQADAELRSSRFRLQQVLESIEDGFLAFEFPGTIFSLNRRAADLLRMNQDSLLGLKIESLFLNSDKNRKIRDILDNWENGEKTQKVYRNLQVEITVPEAEGNGKMQFTCKLDLFSDDEEAGVLFLEYPSDSAEPHQQEQITHDSIELVSLLGHAQHNIRQIGNRLNVMTPREISAHPELISRLAHIEDLIQFIDARMPSISNEGEYRQQLVTLMRAALHTWELTTQKTKIELAEESNIWAVSIDDGRLRTRTFDRYLRLEQLPKIPRWREVVRTAYFVLSNPAIEPETRASLTAELEKTKTILKRAAIS
ncbi:MAG: ATP-binding protein [Pseudohongiellaceae bacterium]